MSHPNRNNRPDWLALDLGLTSIWFNVLWYLRLVRVFNWYSKYSKEVTIHIVQGYGWYRQTDSVELCIELLLQRASFKTWVSHVLAYGWDGRCSLVDCWVRRRGGSSGQTRKWMRSLAQRRDICSGPQDGLGCHETDTVEWSFWYMLEQIGMEGPRCLPAKDKLSIWREHWELYKRVMLDGGSTKTNPVRSWWDEQKETKPTLYLPLTRR